MDKDTKILLMAVVIILVALVSFNLSDLTGKVTKSDKTIIAVSPSVLTFGLHDSSKIITVRVSPGEGGIRKRLLMYRVKTGGYDSVVGSETVSVCNRDICYDDVTVSYRIDAGLLEGRYYFAAKARKGEQVGKSNILEIR